MADQPGQPDSPSRPAPLNLQGTLFDDLPAEQRPGGQPAGIGYRGPTACSAAGITYRQLDYWARTDLVRPSMSDAKGSGTRRQYSYRDLVQLKLIKRLLDAGVPIAWTTARLREK